MKTFVIETLLTLEAVALWTIVLPGAAVLFSLAVLWHKIMALVPVEGFGASEIRSPALQPN